MKIISALFPLRAVIIPIRRVLLAFVLALTPTVQAQITWDGSTSASWGTPLIQQTRPGQFKLTIGVEKNTTLAPLSFTPPYP